MKVRFSAWGSSSSEKGNTYKILEHYIRNEIDGDSPEALIEYFMAKGWGDGLPLVAPTEERVEAMEREVKRRSSIDHSLGHKWSTTPRFPEKRVGTTPSTSTRVSREDIPVLSNM